MSIFSRPGTYGTIDPLRPQQRAETKSDYEMYQQIELIIATANDTRYTEEIKTWLKRKMQPQN